MQRVQAQAPVRAQRALGGRGENLYQLNLKTNVLEFSNKGQLLPE